MPVDLDAITRSLRLISSDSTTAVELVDAIVEDPQVTQTIDGAATLDITVSDAARQLVRSAAIDEQAWAAVGDLHFELVKVSKSTDRLTLTFEDAIVAELRRHTKKLSIKPGTITRSDFVAKLAKEARVPYAVDPAKGRGKVQRVLERSVGGQKTNSWDVLGEAADDVQWRRFSDGAQLVVGSDDWLLTRDPAPTSMREHADGVHTIDFDLDVGKRTSDATAIVDIASFDLPAGAVVEVEDLGPAAGLWLVREVSWRPGRSRATVSLTRSRHELKEPKRQRNTTGGEKGEPGYVPGKTGTPSAPGSAANGAREAMVAFALAQQGKPYVWGASGPSSYDCSGLVQAATAAAGKTLGKPSASQWATVQAAGGAISVEQAIATRGALLFRIGVAEYNHVVISLGNGSTMEAMGSAYGCRIGSTSGRGWTSGGIWL